MRSIYCIIFLLSIMLVACVQMSVKETIHAVEQMQVAKDYNRAKDVVDELLAEDKKQLNATEYCRISIIYMKLAEVNDEDENIALATLCYRNAFESDPDSAVFFYDTLPIDEVAYAEMLRALVESLDTPQNIPPDEHLDSANVID